MKEIGVYYYVCYVLIEESVCVIWDVKKVGIYVIVEVLLYYLILVDEDIFGDEGFWKMNLLLCGLVDW